MWGTPSELSFIWSLKACRGLSRLEVLRGYLEGAKKRTRWVLIDKKQVIAEVEKLIRDIEERSPQAGHAQKSLETV